MRNRPLFRISLLPLLFLAIGLNSCSQYSEGRKLKEKIRYATKPEFQFFAQRAFVVERSEGQVTAIAGEVIMGYASIGDLLLVETTAGPVQAPLLSIETPDETFQEARPGSRAALVFRGIDPRTIRPGALIVMGSTP